MPSYSDPSNCLDEKKRALLERIDGLERWEWKKTLRGGFSGADVLLAWVTHTGRAHSLDVFKFDTAKKSQKEHENCKRYVAPYLNRTNVVQIKAFIRGEVGSLIVYDCGSFDGHLETFAEHYGSVLTPAHTIERLFLKVLEPWYTNSTGVAQDIGGWVSGRVTRIARAIRDELPKLPIDAARAGLHVAPLGRTLPNPLYSAHLPAPACSVRVPVGIIHGDLNARNIWCCHQANMG